MAHANDAANAVNTMQPETHLLINFVRWTLVTMGIVYAVTTSAIMSPLRIALSRRGGSWIQLFIYCPACTAFWAGGLVGVWVFGVFSTNPVPLEVTIIELMFAAMLIASLWMDWRGTSAWDVESDLIHPNATNNANDSANE